MLNMRPNENKNECGAIHDRKKNLTDHKHLNQDGALGAHLLDHIDPFVYMHLQLSGSSPAKRQKGFVS